MTTLTVLSAVLVLTVAAAPAATVSCTPASGLQPRLRASGYEPATIHDTNYPIPSHALFVANNGNDHNPGTKRAPFATIRKAISAAHSGGTIVVRGGVYRESLGTLPRRMTIQAYPHEAPWVRGSAPVSRFTPSGGAWIASWSSPF